VGALLHMGNYLPEIRRTLVSSVPSQFHTFLGEGGRGKGVAEKQNSVGMSGITCSERRLFNATGRSYSRDSHHQKAHQSPSCTPKEVQVSTHNPKTYLVPCTSATLLASSKKPSQSLYVLNLAKPDFNFVCMCCPTPSSCKNLHRSL